MTSSAPLAGRRAISILRKDGVTSADSASE